METEVSREQQQPSTPVLNTDGREAETEAVANETPEVPAAPRGEQHVASGLDKYVEKYETFSPDPECPSIYGNVATLIATTCDVTIRLGGVTGRRDGGILEVEARANVTIPWILARELVRLLQQEANFYPD